ncbi:mll3541 [Mesorhizobium japonicum MAFF 303099]|uniref:Mll3541 protein n=2 Tax=Mesorhizobium japonicum TaxID=2066070 RepID=Q98G06_RHILO|nr:mll3541 [Mesorhizobium japonicum MAFF 303099]
MFRQIALARPVGRSRCKGSYVMTAYAIAHMRQVTMGPQIVEYLHKIDATLEPFGGRFLVHGGDVEVIENDWPGNLIVIEFPDRRHVREWYDSPAYQAILSLRTDNSDSDVIIVDGVEHPHKATDVLG